MRGECDLDWHLFAGHWYILEVAKPKSNHETSEDYLPLSIDYYVDDRGLQTGRPLEIDIVWAMSDSQSGQVFYSCGRGRVLYEFCPSILRVRGASCPDPAKRALNKFPWGFTAPRAKEMSHVVYSTDYDTYALVGIGGQPWVWILGRRPFLTAEASYDVEKFLEEAEI
jgi:hypothetical protein